METKPTKKKPIVYKDESFLENINLVTGNKINFERTLSTQIEIKTLCIDERMPKDKKFLYILNEENKMAKWSIFQNLDRNIETTDACETIFEAIAKQYSQFSNELRTILGDGLQKLLLRRSFQLSDKCKKYIESLFEKTMASVQTINPQISQEWSQAFATYYKNHNDSIDEYKAFINGSFNMNATPERRQVAFIIIRGLIHHPSLPLNQVKTKVLFFNRDQNAITRKIICEIAEKILKKQPEDQQVWKVVWEYFQDSDQNVVKVAVRILCEIKMQSNFLHLSNELDNKGKSKIFLRQFYRYLQHFKQFYKREKFRKQHSKLINFINRIIKSQEQSEIIQIFLSFDLVIETLTQEEVIKQIAFSHLNTSKQKVQASLIDIYEWISDIQFKQKIKGMVLKGIKLNSYTFFQRSEKIALFLDLKYQEQASVYISLCNKMLQNNKWYCLQKMVESLDQLRMVLPVHQKSCLFLLKLILVTPYFLIPVTIKAILYVLLTNRKSLEFLITIREKLMNSKSWIHRRNYILLYFYLKKNSSFDFQKLVPILIYKSLSNQKCVGIKLELLRQIAQSYKYIDPSTQQKNTMRETVKKMSDDKDLLVAKLAQQVQISLMKYSHDVQHIHQAYERNKQLTEKQLLISQVEVESKKIIFTEKNIRRSVNKKKTEVKTTLNLTKEYRKDQTPAIESNKTINVQPKKPSIFRHNSMKVKTLIPTNSSKSKM